MGAPDQPDQGKPIKLQSPRVGRVQGCAVQHLSFRTHGPGFMVPPKARSFVPARGYLPGKYTRYNPLNCVQELNPKP